MKKNSGVSTKWPLETFEINQLPYFSRESSGVNNRILQTAAWAQHVILQFYIMVIKKIIPKIDMARLWQRMLSLYKFVS